MVDQIDAFIVFHQEWSNTFIFDIIMDVRQLLEDPLEVRFRHCSPDVHPKHCKTKLQHIIKSFVDTVALFCMLFNSSLL